MNKHRLKFIAKNLMRIAALLIAVSVAAFTLVTMSPIDPVQSYVGSAAMATLSPEQLVRLERYWGVDTPPIQRYLNWAGDFFTGNMGVSLLYRQDVSSVIHTRLISSLVLMLSAWLCAGMIGLTLGILSGVYRGRMPDRIIRGYALLTASTPAFWLALVLLMIFAVHLKVLPIGLSVPIGVDAASVTLSDRLRHMILPAITLSITGMSNIILHTRQKMIDIMESDFVLFAHARGESTWSIVRRHGLRNVLLPAITLQFASISEIFGGSVLVEQVFSYPGLGQAAVTAGLGGDIPLLLAITVISAAFVFFGNFIANLLYGVADPRIRRGAALWKH